MTDATSNAKRKYEKSRIQKKISLHKERDKAQLTHLNRIKDLSNYMKALIEKDLENGGIWKEFLKDE